MKQAGLALGLPVLQPEHLDRQAREAVLPLGPELLVVVAYGHIFGPRFLSLFPKGAVNLHPSLLPRYRGPSPITAAILAGDSETGITVQRLALSVDSGAILRQRSIRLSGEETTASLSERVGSEGALLLAETLRELDRIDESPQAEGSASYCSLVRKEDGLVDWRRAPEEIERMVRAYIPWPHARTTLRGEELHLLEARTVSADRLRETGAREERWNPGKVIGIDTREGILVQTGGGVLGVRTLQLQSKRPLHWKDFMNGVRDLVGSTLGGKA